MAGSRTGRERAGAEAPLVPFPGCKYSLLETPAIAENKMSEGKMKIRFKQMASVNQLLVYSWCSELFPLQKKKQYSKVTLYAVILKRNYY